jgi:P27 family predicted phage terminase small subunit
VPALAEVGLIDTVDFATLEAIVIQYARLAEAREILARDGIIVLNRFGEMIRHPAVTIERDASLALLRMAEHYGLTPVARVRLGLSELKRQGLQAELGKKYPADQQQRRPADGEPRPT